ncbi:MAG: AMP-binding protein [Rhodospirillales bacterium]|jgi:long-chain acyl-CoA synthetase|nr:long-chain fatty acid--CoA ligase [Rhodospirillaceae bacterium]MDP6426621.1 AMP-binding protein [Rhodospirillales bacterium]MDP6644667.1 AMP-binding protein [Rhodospirillales bacterium]MDP6842242.1 AMP-binding protein [Rhodospirillales bacterium]
MFGSGKVVSLQRSVDKADLAARTRQAASALDSLGIGEGDAIAAFMCNDFPLFEAQCAAALLGAYFVTVNWHLRGTEAEYILTDSEAKALIVHAHLLAEIGDMIPAGIAVFVVPTPDDIAAAYRIDAASCAAPDGARDWRDWIAAFAEWSAAPRAARGLVFYTSGTTGLPKGVFQHPASADQAAVGAQVGDIAYGPRPGMRVILSGPCYHVAVNHSARISLSNEADLYLQPRFDAEQFLQMVETHRITHAHMVPTMFVRLLKLPAEVRQRYDVSSMEQITHGAAPCAAEVKQAMIAWFGPILVEYYGGTEVGISHLCSSEDWLKKPGTVGSLTPNSRVAIYDDDGQPQGPGGIGEIYVKTEMVPDFDYKSLPDKRLEVERDGLISIGDIGYQDEDGYLFLCDRRNDMVISGGVNIYPAEIEAALVTMDGVGDCAVFGIPDAEFGESLMTMIEPEDNAELSETAVREYLIERLAKYKVPKFIEFRKDLPREDSGKIMKRRLREPFWRDADRQI